MKTDTHSDAIPSVRVSWSTAHKVRAASAAPQRRPPATHKSAHSFPGALKRLVRLLSPPEKRSERDSGSDWARCPGKSFLYQVMQYIGYLIIEYIPYFFSNPSLFFSNAAKICVYRVMNKDGTQNNL